MRVVLRASDVAAIIGRNRYKPRSEVFASMWKKYAPETFTGETKEDRVNQCMTPDAKQIIDKAVSFVPKDSSETQQVFEQARIEINSDSKLNSIQKNELIEHVRSKVYTNHGIRSEDKTANTIDAHLVEDNTFYTHEVCRLGDTQFVIVGRVDRVEEKPDGSKILIEIKNRTNRLFGKVVEYEMIQVQVYLKMMGLVHARLVEQYNTQVQSHDIVRDEELWENVITPGLLEFCNEFYATTALPLKKSSNEST